MQTTQVLDLTTEVQPRQDSIISRTLHKDDCLKAVIFGFGAGQELSEHTASMPAVMQFIQGRANVTLGDQHVDAKPGTWIHMQAGQLHAIHAKEPTIMPLLLLKSQR
jgi:quercetin dioxygenase-like cupin family protein